MKLLTLGHVCLLCLGAAAIASAQIDTATISGTVTDQTGAVVVDAKVTVTNASTNFVSNTVTNTEGLFRVQSLRPGVYRVETAASGFRKTIRDGIEVRGGDVAAVNFK